MRLIPKQALGKEYARGDLTSFPATGTTDPGTLDFGELSETYRHGKRGSFADGRLSVEGCVTRPRSLSLSDLKRFTSRTQLTRHTCEEGWTAIGEWTGVPLSLVLDAAGILPSARFVTLYSYDGHAGRIETRYPAMRGVAPPKVARCGATPGSSNHPGDPLG